MKVLKPQYSIRAMLVLLTVVASFFGGLRTRRTALEIELARVQGDADAARRRTKDLEIAIQRAELELQIAKEQEEFVMPMKAIKKKRK